MTRKFEVEVIRNVLVTIDETKFTQEFLDEFSEFISSSIDDILTHVEHLGWLYAAGRTDDDQFIEGYGTAKDFGIKFKEIEDHISDIREI